MRFLHTHVQSVRSTSPGTILALETWAMAMMFLFFLQLFSTVVTSIFAQGLEHRSVPIATIALTFFLAPILASLFYRRSLQRRVSYALAFVALCCRAMTPHFVHHVIWRLAVSSIGTAAMLLFFTSYFALKNTLRKWYSMTLDESYAVSTGVSLALAVCFSIFFRTLGLTLDVSMDGFGLYPLVSWVLVVIAAALLMVMWSAGLEETGADGSDSLLRAHERLHTVPEIPSDFGPEYLHTHTTEAAGRYHWEEGAMPSDHHENIEGANDSELEPTLIGQLVLAASWLTSISLILFTGLNSPTVLARWANANYPLVNCVCMASACVFIALAVFAPALFRKTNPILLFILDIALAVLLFFASFSDAAKDPHWNTMQTVMVYLAVSISPVLYLHFSHISSVLAFIDASSARRGLAFTVASFLLFFTVAGAIFTLTSSYVGIRVFRNLYWLVLLIVLGVSVAGATVGDRYFKRYTTSARSWYTSHIAGDASSTVHGRAGGPPPLLSRKTRVITAVIVGVMLITVMAASFSLVPDPPVHESPTGAIKMITYNILQGYTQHGTPNIRLLARDLESRNLDIIAFQESDTARITGANQDVVRFLAYYLNMHSYYGPKPTTGTYGLSLLTRFPMEHRNIWYLPSENEQIACVETRLRVNQQTSMTVYVTHFGFRFEDDQVKQANFMNNLIGDRNDAVMVCDCNMHPLTKPYNVTTSLLRDAWAEYTGSTEGGFTFDTAYPHERIDYIFPTHGIDIEQVSVLSELSDSDHMPVYATLKIGPQSVRK